MTVLKAISAAGGITQDGLYGKVKLRRKQKGGHEYKEINLNLKNTTESNMNCDMLVEDEDIVVVERSKDFFVYGEVVKPGKYTLEDNMTVLRAISIAGGFAKYGSPDRVKILRAVPGKVGYENIKVDMKSAVKGEVGKDIRLESDDIVIVLEGIL
jgi:polysaccharide export outer membrane protein